MRAETRAEECNGKKDDSQICCKTMLNKFYESLGGATSVPVIIISVALLAFLVRILSLTLFTKLEQLTKRKSNHFEGHFEVRGGNLLQ